jgi:hypothetical protein
MNEEDSRTTLEVIHNLAATADRIEAQVFSMRRLAAQLKARLDGAKAVSPEPQMIEINLNSRKVSVLPRDGRYVLSYEEIVRMTCDQDRKDRGLGEIDRPDDQLPNLSCVYHHRVPFNQLTDERDGSLCRGQKVVCTPGMRITCMDTSNA